MFYIAMRDGPR